MNWYLTKIIYRIVCGEGNHTPQFDEQLRMLLAESEADALQKANNIALQEQLSFFNDRQQLVQWKFVAVTEVYCLHQSLDGAEVYSQLTEVTDAAAYTKLVNHRANATRKEYLVNAFN